MEDASTAVVDGACANEIIFKLRTAIRAGQPWHVALLEAIGNWLVPEEWLGGRLFRYLVANEAFDWLLLAERLTEAVRDVLPSEELEALLFEGRFPAPVSSREFKQLLGAAKYRAFLNYFYGVTLEECLILAVEQEVEKEERARVYQDRRIFEDAYQRIYGSAELELLGQFRTERAEPRQLDCMDVLERKEFTYWLFKYRVKRGHKARVASDTRKAIAQLRSLRGDHPLPWCG
ncbi:MAG: hypothetical protein EPO21_19910 [Chloroflexota bacterium]|nr:MAG: hypothetical protein EPO21_19910 [Chloroflexota bacterium]